MHSTHYHDLYLSLTMGDRGALEMVARVKFIFHPAVRATYDEPGGGATVTAIEVVSISVDHGGGKSEPMPLTAGICDWIAATADHDTLAESAADDITVEEDEAADFKRREARDEPQLYACES